MQPKPVFEVSPLIQGAWLILFALLVSISCLISCSTPKTEKSREEERIDHKDLVMILADLHLADAVIVIQEGKTGIARPTDSTYYDVVLKKYKTNRADFDATIRYYTRHPDDFKKIYNEVINLLKFKEEAALKISKESSKARVPEVGQGKKISNPKEVITGTLPDSVMRKAGANSKAELEKQRLNRMMKLQKKRAKYRPDPSEQ